MKSVKRKWYDMIAFLPKKKFEYMGNLEIEFMVQRDGSVTNMKAVIAVRRSRLGQDSLGVNPPAQPVYAISGDGEGPERPASYPV